MFLLKIRRTETDILVNLHGNMLCAENLQNLFPEPRAKSTDTADGKTTDTADGKTTDHRSLHIDKYAGA